jgi:phage antirepressor YoqD-like protein
MGVLAESGARYNLPKQTYIKRGLFSVKETIYNSKDNKTTSISFHTDVTQKGVAWLIKTFNKRKAGFKKS